MDDASARLASALRDIAAPDALYPLAARAAAEAATSDAPGSLLVAHAIILLVARRLDGEPLEERAWHEVRALMTALAEYVALVDARSLDTVAQCWRVLTNPPAMH